MSPIDQSPQGVDVLLMRDENNSLSLPGLGDAADTVLTSPLPLSLDCTRTTRDGFDVAVFIRAPSGNQVIAVNGFPLPRETMLAGQGKTIGPKSQVETARNYWPLRGPHIDTVYRYQSAEGQSREINCFSRGTGKVRVEPRPRLEWMSARVSE